MISNLTVKNIALIRELNIDFKKGLNILSGETGAGKSIIIDSINFVLGDRADRSLIRHGETSAKVEVVFTDIQNYDEVLSLLKEADIEGDDDCVIVSRTMTNDRSECRINRKIVNLSLLRKVVALLVDTHTQNEHQTLLKTSEHIKILDRYTPKITKEIAKYKELVNNYNKIIDNLKQFPSLEERERQIDILSFQTAEIERVNWQEGEEEELRAKRLYFYNAQKIFSSLKDAYGSISGDNGMGGVNSVDNAISSLKSVAQYDESISDLVERLNSVSIELSDISETLYDKLQNDDLSDLSIEKIENRLDEIRLLQKKFGKTYQDVQEFYRNALEKLDIYSNSESKISALAKEKELLEGDIIEQVKIIHKIRNASSKVFCKEISDNLRELGMKNAVFEIFSDYDESNIIERLNAFGAENIEFMLSPNLGEPVKSLAKIASGGEMSRFMLAIKNVIAEIDNVDSLIFDEIDTGISGAIAKVVAEKLYNISTKRQVIAITHLPQLASMGDVNFLIEKNVVDNKTITSLRELKNEDIYKELMRLSGAVENSKVGYDGAVELKNQADNYKLSHKK